MVCLLQLKLPIEGIGN